jgi:hypothetical protein
MNHPHIKFIRVCQYSGKLEFVNIPEKMTQNNAYLHEID